MKYDITPSFLFKLFLTLPMKMNMQTPDYILKKGNKLTELLLSEILEDGRIYMIPALCRDVYFLRLAVVAERTTSEDIRFSFEVIKTCADKVLRSSGDFKEDEPVFVDIDLSRKKPTQPSKIKTHK